MVRLGKIKSIRGSVILPGDKSIAHRTLIHAALSMGDCVISNLPESLDVYATINALEILDVSVRQNERGECVIKGGASDFAPPEKPIDCKNSGTTMRLIMGVLASCPFESELTGDSSLMKRPMERIAEPLRMMGVEIVTTDGHAPVRIIGKRDLKPIEYTLPVASAQVKSGLIYAAIAASGESVIIEENRSRDHTERAFESICKTGYRREIQANRIIHRINGPANLDSFSLNIPSDPSSAAYLIALALMMPDSEIELNNLLLNPTRIKYLEVLKSMGASIEIIHTHDELNEPVGTVFAKTSNLKNVEIDPKDIPLLIDEIPLLGVIATKSDGVMSVKGASELRLKESDRIKSLVENLTTCGFDASEHDDSFTITGGKSGYAGRINHHDDHRILMSMIVLSIIHGFDIEFTDTNPLRYSFPEFLDYINLLCV